MQPANIALVGLSGSGKSTVARLLAQQLGWWPVDTDALVVAQAGMPVATIFAAHGEAHFRDLEAAALAEALAGERQVIATGGGVVLRAENRALLRARALVVWLDAPGATLAARLAQHDEQRPLLAGDMLARLEDLRVARAGLYRETAHLVIDTAGHDPAAIAAQILNGTVYQRT